jgi:hypothetical protein
MRKVGGQTLADEPSSLAGPGLGWLDETELETISHVRVGEPTGDPEAGDIHYTGMPPDPHSPRAEATRLTHDMARQLKQLAGTVFGYPDGERRLRADLGFEPDEKLSLRRLAAHVSVARYETLLASYRASLQQEVEADVP